MSLRATRPCPLTKGAVVRFRGGFSFRLLFRLGLVRQGGGNLVKDEESGGRRKNKEMTYAKAHLQEEAWYGALRRLRTVLINSRVGA